MKKERLAIVSSYDDFCGNASYTKALVKELSQYFDVTVISLNVDLLRKGDARCAKQHLLSIREKLKAFDCVNIQFEAGLFGQSPEIVRKRFFMIAKSCKKLLLTMHRYHAKENHPGLIGLCKNIVKGRLKHHLKEFKRAYGLNRYSSLYNSMIRFCLKRKFPILVHTSRDRELIQLKFGYDRIYDHPLCFYHQKYVETLSKIHTREIFCRSLSLDQQKIYIGIFGFLSGNKGHDTAIKALNFLPEQYELLIMGAQHPHSIRPNASIDPYINYLLELIKKQKCGHRVKFYRLANDEELLKGMLGCDFNVLPYLEVAQGGSSIAALALETRSKSIFSQNFAFFELEKYAPNAIKMFSIGNHLELARAILSYQQSDFREPLQEYHKKYNIHTSVALYKKLLISGECTVNLAAHSFEGAIPCTNTQVPMYNDIYLHTI